MAMSRLDQSLAKQAELQQEYADSIAHSMQILNKLADVQEELEAILREEEDTLREQIVKDSKPQQQEVE